MGASQSNCSKRFVYEGKPHIVCFDDEPFAEGGCRYAYKGHLEEKNEPSCNLPRLPRWTPWHAEWNDLLGKREMVVKVFKADAAKEATSWTPEIKQYKIAQHYVDGFNQVAGANKTIKFVDVRVVQMDTTAGFWWFGFIGGLTKKINPNEYVILEPKLPGHYTKALSNNGWVAKRDTQGFGKASHLLQAFAHYTYHASNGACLVCDLQGVDHNVPDKGQFKFLTDPAIHSVDQRYGATDHGLEGFARFFATHECHEFCDKRWLRFTLPPKSTVNHMVPSTTFRVPELDSINRDHLEAIGTTRAGQSAYVNRMKAEMDNVETASRCERTARLSIVHD